MSRLTPFARLLIAVGIVGGLYFAYTKFSPQLNEKFGKKATTEASTTASSDDAGSTSSGTTSGASGTTTPTTSSESTPQASSSTTSAARPKFDYTAPVPSGGKMRGVVELGASGFNSFVVTMDKAKNWKLEKAEFGNSLVMENMATDDDIRIGLKKYIGTMLDYGVMGRDIHFVVSSGAVKAEGTQKIISVLKSMNYVVNTVTAQSEGQLGLKCVLPKDFQNDAFVVDIGSGNTKISWLEGGNIKAVESHGAKYFQNGLSDNAVFSDVKGKASQVPGTKRKMCFIIGGAPFEMAKQVRTGKERYTILSAPDKYTPKDAKGKAGVNIYKAIADATDCQQFVFDWDANFTIGFLLGLPN